MFKAEALRLLGAQPIAEANPGVGTGIDQLFGTILYPGDALAVLYFGYWRQNGRAGIVFCQGFYPGRELLAALAPWAASTAKPRSTALSSLWAASFATTFYFSCFFLMTIAFFSDVHSNLPALQAVLANIKASLLRTENKLDRCENCV